MVSKSEASPCTESEYRLIWMAEGSSWQTNDSRGVPRKAHCNCGVNESDHAELDMCRFNRCAEQGEATVQVETSDDC